MDKSLNFTRQFWENRSGAMITLAGFDGWVQVSKCISKGGLIWAVKADESRPSLSPIYKGAYPFTFTLLLNRHYSLLVLAFSRSSCLKSLVLPVIAF